MMKEIIEIEGIPIFDSWIEPGPELRADNPVDRHLIYEGGGIILDLLLKPAVGGDSLHIGGQVLPSTKTLSTVSDLKVLMERGKDRSYTYTNALGEFAFQAVPSGKFDLSITLKNKRFNVRGLSNSEPRMWRVVPSMAVGGD